METPNGWVTAAIEAGKAAIEAFQKGGGFVRSRLQEAGIVDRSKEEMLKEITRLERESELLAVNTMKAGRAPEDNAAIQSRNLRIDALRKEVAALDAQTGAQGASTAAVAESIPAWAAQARLRRTSAMVLVR